MTGIEIGPDSCALVAARQAGRMTGISALHVIESIGSSTVQLTETLAALRRTRRFPRRARAVIWGTPEVTSANDPVTAGILRPFLDAGFRIESTTTPPQALAVLASTRRHRDPAAAVAWMAINTHGAAIAIVRGADLLYARTVVWSYLPGRSGSTAQLLQRYSLVAHLAPEVQRGIADVRARHGVAVETAVTCGDLPDLRSLTMPLIEELDLEVETLDSLEEFQVVGGARNERFAENAPALRLAIAAALGPAGAAGRSAAWRAWQAAAVVGVASGLLWLAYALRGSNGERPAETSAKPAVTSPAPSSPETTTRVADASRIPRSAAPAPAPPTPATTVPVEAASRTAPPGPTRPAPSVDTTEPPRRSPQVPADSVPTKVVPRPGPEPPSPSGSALPAPRTVAPVREPPPEPGRRDERRVPLRTPLPRLDSILVDGDRRLAVLDGQIVAVGGRSGDRTVVRIDADAVVLREPSGLEVRVTIGSLPG